MLVAIALLSVLVGLRAEESIYKLRVHKNLIQRTIDENFPSVLNHIEKKVEKNVFLTEVNANIDNLSLKIIPVNNGKWEHVDSKLTFLEHVIIANMEGLEYVGSGEITDPNTGIRDTIEMVAVLSKTQLFITFSNQTNDDGFVLPMINFNKVHFKLDQDQINVKLQGDLPVYKTD